MTFKLLILKYYFLSYIKHIFSQAEKCKARVWVERRYHLIRFLIIQTIQVRERERESALAKAVQLVADSWSEKKLGMLQTS